MNSDLLVIGQNGGEYPVEGKIFGIDPKNGNLKWTFYTTGRDDPKALATWGGRVLEVRRRRLLAAGHGRLRQQPDPDGHRQSRTRTTTTAAPTAATSTPTGHRPGDNLYTSSTVALDLDTGKLNWYFQEAPSDPYDYDAAPGEYVIFNDDQGRRLVLHPGKNGFNHVHDVATGQPINVYPDMKNQNWTSGFNLETGQWENMLWPIAGEKTLVCPAIDGGHSWNPGTYNPADRAVLPHRQRVVHVPDGQPEGGRPGDRRLRDPGDRAVRGRVHGRAMGRRAASRRLDPRPPDRA